MSHSTRLPASLTTITSWRAFWKWAVAIGGAILVIGSLLAWRSQDDAEYPAVGALRLTDGTVAWSVRSPVEAYRTVIGSSDDIVLIEESVPSDWDVPLEQSRSISRHTIAFDTADGSELWRRSTGYTPIPPGPINGQGIVVLVDQDAGVLVGVDVKTGDEQWSVASREVPLANSPTVAVVWDMTDTSDPSGFRGIDRLTGEELWISDTMLSDQSGTDVGRSPAAVFDEVMAVPTGETVTAIDMRTGAILWQAQQLKHLAAAEGTIVGKRGANEPGKVVSIAALDAASGQERWTAAQQAYDDVDFAVADGAIVIMDQLTEQNSSFPGLIAYELSSGNERWRMPLTQFFAPHQIQISGTSLVMRGDRELAVLSTTEGSTLWSATEPLGSSETIPPQMISVGSSGDTIFVAINSVPSPCAPRCD